jgi:phosphoribosylanthranilate isomerase
VPAAVLVDAFVPGQHGGTGQTVPWNLLADFQPGVPLLLFIANAREAAARCG